MGIIAGGQVCGTQVEGEAYDGLQNLAFDRQQMDLFIVLIAAPILKVPSLLSANPSGSVGL